MAISKIVTASITDNAVTAAKVPVDGLAATDIAANAITASELADDAVDAAAVADGAIIPSKIPYFENATTTQNLTGTYSTERMYLNDSYTITGNVTLTGHLSLSTLADANILITNDSTARTITGSGVLEAGKVHSKISDLTGMTGQLGNSVTLESSVTGSPALNLHNSTFPAGCILQVKQGVSKVKIASTTDPNFLEIIQVQISPISTSSKIYIMFCGQHGNFNPNGGLRLYRGGAAIGDASGSFGGGGGFVNYDDMPGSASTMHTTSFNWLDETPNVTGAITYKVMSDSCTSLYWNQQQNGSGNGTTTIIAMEIAG